MVSIGIDVGGTGIQIGVVDEKGTILEKSSIVFRLEDGWERQIHDMAACALETLSRSGYTELDVRSVGVGVPGLANQRTGEVIFCTNLAWHNVPFRQEFQKYLNKPVYIDNDATVAGLAESVAGVSAGTDSSVFITLGTGVGGGIVIHGRVWSGFHGTGSEIGHMIMALDGVPCTCGNHGCTERYCSATAMIRDARDLLPGYPDSAILKAAGGDPGKINAKIIVDAARVEDPLGVRVYKSYVRNLGVLLANIMNFLDPEVIVLGGGVSKAGDFLLDAVREEALKYVLFKGQPYSRVELARLGPDAGIIGAAMLSGVD